MLLAKDLRDAVLQAAMQGKLTEQLETDSSVKDTIINIRKFFNNDSENAQNESLNIIPFDIPNNWEWIRLKDIIRIKSGDNLTKKSMQFGEIPVYGGNGINGNHNMANVFKPTVVIGRVGAKCGSVHITKNKAWVTDNAFIVTFPEKYINILFLKMLLIYSKLGSKAKATAQPVISGVSIYPVVVPLPPLEEQQRIVERVNALMAEIDEYEKIENELVKLKKDFPQNMKAAILQAAMQGKLTEQLETDSSVDELLEKIQKQREELIKKGELKNQKKLASITSEDIPFDIPDNWKWEKWGNISNSIQYGYNSPAQSIGQVYMVRISDICDNEIQWDNVPFCNINEKDFETYQLFENDLLFARTGGTVGKSVLVKNIPSKAVFAGYLIRSNYNKRLVSKYLKYFMDSELYWQQLRNGTTQTAQPNCNAKTLSQMLIPLPPIEEQQRIVEKLDALLPLCEELGE